MNAHTKFPDPLASHEEALVDAERANICQSDVGTLIEIGEDIADFSRALAAKLMSLTDGRLATIYPDKGGVVHQCANFNADQIRTLFMEAVLDGLDHYDVIQTASVIRAMRASELDRSARFAPLSAVASMVGREMGQ